MTGWQTEHEHDPADKADAFETRIVGGPEDVHHFGAYRPMFERFVNREQWDEWEPPDRDRYYDPIGETWRWRQGR